MLSSEELVADLAKTGLVEGFCNFDTGHDNSPRWAGIPNSCPREDARKCPQLASLPRLRPDLSATVYGERVALAGMADALGKQLEADRWREDAERIRQLIIDRLYCPEDAAFYDLDGNDRFVRVRSDVISRVTGEHVLKLRDCVGSTHLRLSMDAATSQSQCLLVTVPFSVNRAKRSNVCAADSGQQLGRSGTGPDGASCSTLDGALRQT
jgi:hypothetical protein